MTKKQMQIEINLLRNDLNTVIAYLMLQEKNVKLDKSIIEMLFEEQLACSQPGLLDD